MPQLGLVPSNDRRRDGGEEEEELELGFLLAWGVDCFDPGLLHHPILGRSSLKVAGIGAVVVVVVVVMALRGTTELSTVVPAKFLDGLKCSFFTGIREAFSLLGEVNDRKVLNQVKRSFSRESTPDRPCSWLQRREVRCRPLAEPSAVTASLSPRRPPPPLIDSPPPLDVSPAPLVDSPAPLVHSWPSDARRFLASRRSTIRCRRPLVIKN
ncbi:hypothetical protein GUJ93_ZPchr0005g14642 [Zizania palustris]|uniref:Uncharacterized protein n=1 Tax=Zizania palustris TaxID=103762 RepID=A0A8J5SKJ1_ZIZPA|nr:hypothetical protein GUJ93_ZPchr0005g14642 [Zizania palustris]